MVPTLSWKQGTWDSASATYFYSLSDSLFSYFLEKEAFAFLGRFFEARPQLLASKEAIQTRDYCVANNATLRADRPDPSRDKKRLAQDDN